MENSAEISRPSLLFAAIMVTSLAFTCFFISGISPLLVTFSVLVLSTVSIATFTKRRVTPYERTIQGENVKQKKEIGMISESESTEESMTSEEFDLNWIRSNNEDQSPPTSDDSISDDEDSLIEIALPGQHSASSKQKPESNLPDFFPDSSLQQGLKGLLDEINEVNEEDNLIEIDISIGSIKCSSLEVGGIHCSKC